MSAGKEDVEEGPPDSDGNALASPGDKATGRSKKRVILIGALASALLLGAAGSGYFFFVRNGQTAEVVTPAADELVDVAPITVNLRSANGTTQMLKVHFMLVPGEKTKEEITARLPIVIDAYQPFLRELRPEDLAGSAATFRLKEEMLVRANAAVGPKSVRDVLIQDLMQQ
jgi:flagellar FliL protein